MEFFNQEFFNWKIIANKTIFYLNYYYLFEKEKLLAFLS